MRRLLLIALVLLTLSVNAQKDSIPPIPLYDSVSYGGFEVDKYCSLEKRRANADARSNKLYFIEVGINEPRYSSYMYDLCHVHNLTYYYLPEAQIGYSGFNPIRCYIASMDSAIKAKYGKNIKNTITASADSSFLAHLSNDTVDEKYCLPASLKDTAIHLNLNGEIFHVQCDRALYNTFKKLASPVAEPIMLVSLLIEADGKVNHFSLNYFYSEGAVYYGDTIRHSKVYDNCGNEFWQLAMAHLKKYPVWQPATIGITPVRTWHNVQVVFEPSPKAN